MTAYEKEFEGIHVVTLEPYHIRNIKPQSEQSDFLEKMPPNWEDLLDLAGDSFAILNDQDEIITVCGVLPLKGEACVWAVHSDLFKNHLVEVTRAVLGFMKDVIDSGLYSQLVGHVKKTFKGGHRWMETLKFDLNEKRHDFGFDQAIYERTF